MSFIFATFIFTISIIVSLITSVRSDLALFHGALSLTHGINIGKVNDIFGGGIPCSFPLSQILASEAERLQFPSVLDGFIASHPRLMSMTSTEYVSQVIIPQFTDTVAFISRSPLAKNSVKLFTTPTSELVSNAASAIGPKFAPLSDALGTVVKTIGSRLTSPITASIGALQSSVPAPPTFIPSGDAFVSAFKVDDKVIETTAISFGQGIKDAVDLAGNFLPVAFSSFGKAAGTFSSQLSERGAALVNNLGGEAEIISRKASASSSFLANTIPARASELATRGASALAAAVPAAIEFSEATVQKIAKAIESIDAQASVIAKTVPAALEDFIASHPRLLTLTPNEYINQVLIPQVKDTVAFLGRSPLAKNTVNLLTSSADALSSAVVIVKSQADTLATLAASSGEIFTSTTNTASSVLGKTAGAAVDTFSQVGAALGEETVLKASWLSQHVAYMVDELKDYTTNTLMNEGSL